MSSQHSTVSIPPGYMYGCVHVHVYAGCCHASEMYAKDLKDLLRQAVPQNGVAAFINESIQVHMYI